MSGRYQVKLVCDQFRCPTSILIVGHLAYEDARGRAQELGWACLPNKRDLCPEHRHLAQQHDGRNVTDVTSANT